MHRPALCQSQISRRPRASAPQLKRDPLGRYEHHTRFCGGRRRASTEGSRRSAAGEHRSVVQGRARSGRYHHLVPSNSVVPGATPEGRGWPWAFSVPCVGAPVGARLRSCAR